MQTKQENQNVITVVAPELGETLLQTAAGQAPDLHTALRVSKSALRTASFQEDVVTQVCRLVSPPSSPARTSAPYPKP